MALGLQRETRTDGEDGNKDMSSRRKESKVRSS